jgi:hypothetical protein
MEGEVARDVMGTSSQLIASWEVQDNSNRAMYKPRYPLASDDLRGLHLSCAIWPFRAVVRVNSAPHRGQVLFDAVPDFSRWCRKRLLNVENCRPLQPCSQHCGFGREFNTRGITELL